MGMGLCPTRASRVRSVNHVTTKGKEVDHNLWVWGSVPRARGSPAIIQLKINNACAWMKRFFCFCFWKEKDCEQSLFCSKIHKREYLSSKVPRVARARIRSTSSQPRASSLLVILSGDWCAERGEREGFSRMSDTNMAACCCWSLESSLDSSSRTANLSWNALLKSDVN